jgi:RNA polymerase sigma factor (sigma-70 family)
MAQVLTTSVVRQLESLFDGGSVAGLTDRQLIERFVARRDHAAEDAFAALVTRHGPMVLGVCRQLLGDHQHAEDAFQAVFLVLARRARSVRDPDLLSHWLYGVALRTARKARTRLDRRRKLEEHPAVTRPEAVPADRSAVDREQAEALHEEIERLPGAFRLPVVLCYFEGLSLDEAARRLHCPAGTVHSRLVRARDKLRRGLTRRGVVLPAAALTAALGHRSASASVSSPLCAMTTRAAMNFAAGQAAAAPSATALAQEVLRSMLSHKLRLTAMTLLLASAVASGAGYLSLALAMKDEPPKVPAATQNQVTDANPEPAPGRMFVTGRVLDPNGKPVPDATVMAYASLKWPGRGDRVATMMPSAIGRAGSDDSGRFRLDAARTSSSRHYQVGAVAIAPGYGAGWVELDPDVERPSADIALRPEQAIRGRLFDVQGRPARGVAVSVEKMGTIVAGGLGTTVNEIEGPFFLRDQPGGLPAWPRPATSDADGRFTIRGAGRGLRIGLLIDDPRFARLTVEVDTDSPSDSRDVTIAVEPARIITGRVTYADTGLPAAHAVVNLTTSFERYSAWAGDFETDDQGAFRANPGSADRYIVSAFPREREPYLYAQKRLDWPKGAIEHRVELALPRGILVRGRVTEEGSGKPIAGARISYISNPDRDPQSGAGNSRAATAADGSFLFGVMPAPGYLTVLGPGEDYVLRELGQRMAMAGQPGGRRLYSHAFHALTLKPGSPDQDIAIALRPSLAVKGHVVGPDGQPVRNAMVISRVILQPLPIAWLYWTLLSRDAVRDGSFAVHGLPPDAEVPVYFLDAKHNLGATAMLSGRTASGGPVTVRLQHLGAARARLVDAAGKPVAGSRDAYGSHMTMMVVTPGPIRWSQDPADQGLLAADQDFLARFDPIHYPKGLVSDAQGQLALPALIPGATYRIYDTTLEGGDNPRLRKEFTVKPGETLDLGDILIEKPKA